MSALFCLIGSLRVGISIFRFTLHKKMAFIRIFALTGLVAAASAGIYPDGHFDVAVKISDEAVSVHRGNAQC